MNMKYMFVVAFLSFCVVQTTQGLPQQNERDVVDELLKAILEALGNVRVIISSAIERATEALKNLLEKIEEEIQPTITDVINKTECAIKDMKDKIAAGVDEAQKLGVDVTDCVKDEEDDFKNILNNCMQSEKACVTDEISKLQESVKNATKTINDVRDDVKDVFEKAINCTGPGITATVKCLNRLLSDVIKMQKDEPAKIASIVAKVKEDAQQAVQRASECALEEGTKAAAEIIDHGAQINDCIKEKINNH